MFLTKSGANINRFEKTAKFLVKKMTKCRCKTYFRIIKNHRKDLARLLQILLRTRNGTNPHPLTSRKYQL